MPSSESSDRGVEAERWEPAPDLLGLGLESGETRAGSEAGCGDRRLETECSASGVTEVILDSPEDVTSEESLAAALAAATAEVKAGSR